MDRGNCQWSRPPSQTRLRALTPLRGGPSFAAQHLVAKWKPIKQSAMMLAKALKVSVEELVDEFISEDDLKTFDGWLRYQAVDASATPSEELANWQHIFEDVRQRRAVNPKGGLMKHQPVPGEFKYAVAVGEGADLWLVLWVRRSAKGEVFVMKPMGDRDWNPHTSYHLDGTLHVKSHGRKMLTPQKRQPLTGSFQGTVDLGIDAGYAPKAVGAICDPTAFSGVVKVPSGVLGPKYGAVGVVLVEPGHAPPDYTWGYEVVTQMVFRDVSPHVVITVLRQKPLHA